MDQLACTISKPGRRICSVGGLAARLASPASPRRHGLTATPRHATRRATPRHAAPHEAGDLGGKREGAEGHEPGRLVAPLQRVI
jgi:hypothetical protein